MKEGEFVEIEYTGRIKESGEVFDTTSEEIAKQAGIYSRHMMYGPIVVVVGAGHVIDGLDEALKEMKEGEEKTITLPPEKAFGKREQKLVRIFPTSYFKKQGITPRAGQIMYFGNVEGRIVSVSSGRVIVDFNHPLAGKTVEYEVKILRKVKDVEEQVKSIFKYHTFMPDEGFSVKIDGKKAIISIKMVVADHLKKKVEEEIKEYVDGVDTVEFVEEKDEKHSESEKPKEEKASPKA